MQLIIHCNTNFSILSQSGNAYKMIQFVSGYSFTTIRGYIHFARQGDLLFLSPGEVISWNKGSGSVIHYIEVRPQYFKYQPHVVKLFKEHPCFSVYRAITMLSYQQATAISMLFKMIRLEAAGHQDDKKQAILLHLQMLLLLSGRAVGDRVFCLEKT